MTHFVRGYRRARRLQALIAFKLKAATRILQLLLLLEDFVVAPNARSPPPRSWMFCDTHAGVAYRGRPYPIAEDLPPAPLSRPLRAASVRIARDQHEFAAAEVVRAV